MAEVFDPLKLENQLCFPLYAASRALIRQYHPALSALDLTYTQYVAMMALWESAPLSVKELGERLYLDTGTLTPLLKAMEQKGLIRRRRSEADERSVIVSLTDEGAALRKKALSVPAQVGGCIRLDASRAQQLCGLLYELLDALEK